MLTVMQEIMLLRYEVMTYEVIRLQNKIKEMKKEMRKIKRKLEAEK